MDNDNDPNQPYISYELAEDESDDEKEFRLRQIAVVGAVLYLGAEESRHEHLARRKARRTYLIRGGPGLIMGAGYDGGGGSG
jgi:hypothetical protein